MYTPTLLLYWPVERPVDQPLGQEIDHLVAEGLVYVEDIGHGWRRMGLTKKGREAADELNKAQRQPSHRSPWT